MNEPRISVADAFVLALIACGVAYAMTWIYGHYNADIKAAAGGAADIVQRLIPKGGQ